MDPISTKKVLPSSSFSHPSVSSSPADRKTSSKMTLNKTVVAVFVFAILGAQVEGSFVTKINNGFERLVVSIDDQLALPLTSPQTSTTASSSSYKGATQECQFILEQLKNLISRTSDYLFKATNGKSYFRQVSILLPSNWATSNCTGADQEVSTATYQSSGSSDIVLTGDHPVYIDKPWTLQYGPCGVPGKKISVPVSFISSVNDKDTKARLMVREWVKLRYGVFDENGFAHDEKYPAEYVGPHGKPVQTACHLNRTDDVINCTGDKCDQSRPVPHSHSHSHNEDFPSSSMMSLPLDPHGNEFCDEHTHVRTTPTKHNFLCDGRSIWEVMNQHGDFTIDTEYSQQQVPTASKMSNGSPYETSTSRSTSSSSSSSSTAKSIVSAPAPVFSYVTTKSHRMIFLLDRSRAMNQNNRWVNLRRSLYRMFHYLPSGVELGVISYTNSSTLSLPLTVASAQNRDHLHGRVPGRPLTTESEEPCVSCALRAAVKLIKSSDESIGPATLVLVNGSPNKIMSREWDKIKKIIDNTPLRIIVLTYANTNDNHASSSSGGAAEQLVQLAQYGGFYKVPETTTSGANQNLEQNEILNSIFLQIISENVGTPLNKVYDAVHLPDGEWQARGKFTVEESLGRNTWVTVTTEESGDVEGLQLISPTGKEFDLPRHIEGLVLLKIPGVTEAGIWTYIVKFYQTQSPRPISVDVITESRKVESISVKSWNHVAKQEPQVHANHPNIIETSSTSSVAISSAGSSETTTPMSATSTSTTSTTTTTTTESSASSVAFPEAEVVLLYTQVLQGELPVLNANVTATITLPGNNQHSPNTISVRLYDTGSGDPDITWGDGIYSAYFTQLGSNPGFYSVSIHIDDNKGQAVVPVHTNISRGFYDMPTCCGSSVPHIATIPTGSFSRTIASSSFNINHGVPVGEDPYPPGRITDLRVERQIDSSSEVKLSWTAPGGDYDKGKASRYEIRCYTSREALTNDNFGTRGILVRSSIPPTPEEYGSRQNAIVSVPWSNEYFYYGIIGVDNSQNRGKVSNLVSVFIKETPTSTTKLADAWEDDALVSNLTSSRSANSKNDGMFHAGANWFRGLNEKELFLILAGGAAFLTLISVCVLILVCVKRKKNKSSEAPPAYHNIYNQGAKGGQPTPSPKDAIGCCWENESNSTDPKLHQSSSVPPQKMNGLNSPYITESKSYIPASALCAPMQPSNNGSIYRDMYAGSGSTQHTHTHDSSSVDSKPSDGGSNETVHVSDGHHTPASFYSQSHQQGPNHRMSNNMMNMSFESQHNLHNNHSSHNNLSRDLGGGITVRGEPFTTSDDDEGGFKGRRNLEGFHKIVPMPSSEYDSPSIMNGSTYGGSVMSIPNSNKKRTRHISFV